MEKEQGEKSLPEKRRKFFVKKNVGGGCREGVEGKGGQRGVKTRTIGAEGVRRVIKRQKKKKGGGIRGVKEVIQRNRACLFILLWGKKKGGGKNG